MASRVVVDLAMVLAAMTAIPVIAVTIPPSRFWPSAELVGRNQAAVRLREAALPFTVASDASITPVAAGRSLSAIDQTAWSTVASRTSPKASHLDYRTLGLSPTMFAPHGKLNFPGPIAVLDATVRGLSADEMTFLRNVASSSVWPEFDRVARAPAVDMIGGEFSGPFKSSAAWWNLPSITPSANYEIANAAVSRAAYHLAIGQRDSAEAILRSVVSFGVRLLDSSPGLTDGRNLNLVGLGVFDINDQVGPLIVNVGTTALERFYVITHDPRAAAIHATFPVDLGVAKSSQVMSPAQSRARFLELANDPAQLRGVRLASLEMLSVSTCSSVRDLFLGPRADVSAAFAKARRELIRFPSDAALIDLIERLPGASLEFERPSFVRRLVVGSSAVAGAMLRNPRLASCAVIATQGRPPF